MAHLRRSVVLTPFLIVAMMAVSALPARCAPSDVNSIVTPHQEVTVLPYVARVYFDAKAKDGSDSYFEVLKNDKPIYIQKARYKGEKFFIGTMYKDDPDASLVKMGMDVTGDGQPDLVISEWLGGANCCLLFHIFEIGPNFRKIATIDAEFGDSGPHFVHADQNSQGANSKSTGLAVQIRDWTFANWHTDFADSPAPKVMLRFSANAYRVAPDLMRTPAPAAGDLDGSAASIRSYVPSAKGGAWPHADIPPALWTTMLDLIYGGHADEAWKFLDQAWPPKVRGKEIFARDFSAQLAKSRYWPAVKAMNASPPPPSPSATATK